MSDPTTTTTTAPAAPPDGGFSRALSTSSESTGGESSAGGDASASPGGEAFSWDTIEPKFQVKNDKGEIDKDATAAKLAKSYKHASDRLNTTRPSGEGVPETAADYVIEVPEALAGAFDTSAPQFQAFQAEAHKLGITQDQMAFLMGKYLEEVPKLVQGAAAMDERAAIAELRTHWPNADDFDANVGLADRAIAQLGEGDKALLAAARNKPAVIRFLARVGSQLQEDIAPANAAVQGSSSIGELQASEAYSNPRHPKHAEVSKKVSDYYGRQAGAQERL